MSGQETGAAAAVRRVMERYVEAVYKADVGTLRELFHPAAVMSGYLGDTLLAGSPEPFLVDVGGRPSMESTGAPYTAEILDIHASSRTREPAPGGDGLLRRAPASSTTSTCSRSRASGRSSPRPSNRSSDRPPAGDHMSELTPLTRDLSVFNKLELEKPPVGVKFLFGEPEGHPPAGEDPRPLRDGHRGADRQGLLRRLRRPRVRRPGAAGHGGRRTLTTGAARSAPAWRCSRRRGPIAASTTSSPPSSGAPATTRPSRRSTS